jgi:hypothetical protein
MADSAHNTCTPTDTQAVHSVSTTHKKVKEDRRWRSITKQEHPKANSSRHVASTSLCAKSGVVVIPNNTKALMVVCTWKRCRVQPNMP